MSRQVAAELLVAVDSRRCTLDDALSDTQAFGALEGSDRGFARALASAALRQRGRLHRALAPLLKRPIETATPATKALLEIGAVQIWLLGTPEHAAVSETVSAAKAWPKANKSAGFLNAVLRQLPARQTDFDALAPETIWPDWLRQVFASDLAPAEVARLARAQMDVPALHLTARTGTASALAEQVGGEALPSGAVQLPAASHAADLPGFTAGDWWVQDAAAALPARCLAVRPGETVIDLCAAPGGKTMQLAAAGARVLAVDRSAARLARLRENLDRTGLSGNVEIICAKGEDWRPDEPADAILVDAPCSALGTLRRHPEGAWIKRPDEIAGYPAVQARLLRAALDMIKPGGRLVYCVCTPLKREGADVVEAALDEGLCQRAPVTAPECPGFETALTERGDVLTIPAADTHPHDAFFASRLIKSA